MTEMTIRARDGLQLEAALDGRDGSRGVCVFCHPHPGFGGTMNAPLLLALRDELVGRGLQVLRFNFRGIGRSEGSFGLGVEEVADAAGALDEAARLAPGLPLTLVGWSFGGAVAIRAAAAEDRVAGCVAVAPALAAKEGIVAGVPSAAELGFDVPLLVVIGVNDEQVSLEACVAWTEEAPRARLVEMPGANHFFWGKYPDLCETAGSWLEEVL